MKKDYMPGRDDNVVQFMMRLASTLESNPSSFGVEVSEAAALRAEVDGFVAAWRVTANEATRTKPATTATREAKRVAVATVRRVVRRVQAWEGITNEKRALLDIPLVASGARRVHRPRVAPGLRVRAVTCHGVELKVFNGATGGVRKPGGVQGATILGYVGDHPPREMCRWSFVQSTTQTKVDVRYRALGEVEPGARVWLTAFWFNPRCERGPACEPVQVRAGMAMGVAA